MGGSPSRFPATPFLANHQEREKGGRATREKEREASQVAWRRCRTRRPPGLHGNPDALITRTESGGERERDCVRERGEVRTRATVAWSGYGTPTVSSIGHALLVLLSRHHTKTATLPSSRSTLCHLHACLKRVKFNASKVRRPEIQPQISWISPGIGP